MKIKDMQPGEIFRLTYETNDRKYFAHHSRCMVEKRLDGRNSVVWVWSYAPPASITSGSAWRNLIRREKLGNNTEVAQVFNIVESTYDYRRLIMQLFERGFGKINYSYLGDVEID